MKVVGIIQARMSSTRLPGKILKDLCGRSVLAHDVIRLRAARLVDEVVVATTDQAVDDAVAAEAERCGALVFRGSEQDVLSRYCLAARAAEADVVVRMTSDCPLFDPVLLDAMLEEFLSALRGAQPFDYYSNTLNTRTYPTGLDAEIFTRQALERAHTEATEPYQREHVTPYFYQNPQLFHLGGMSAAVDHSGHRWTLDTPDDWRLINAIYQAVYRPEGPLFTTDEVLDLFDRNPHWLDFNRHVSARPVDPGRLGTVVIRADASGAIGSGHVMRCLALAQAWPAEAGRVIFAMAEGAEAFGQRLRDEGLLVVELSAPTASRADARQTLDLVQQHQAGWLVVDGYGFDAAYTAEVGRDRLAS